MQEKLIEHWLDSINERGYQPAFLQMLAGEGHTVVHSTRHMAIEFGKDVVSIDRDGVPCAFQLKGNPGKRLTLAQFREIKVQIDELVEQPICYPGIPDTAHKCYLVTNGEIEEEVQRAVDDLNRGYEKRGFHHNSRLRLFSRGMLLDWAIKYSSTFWPESFSIHEKLIRFYNEDGVGALNLDLLSKGLDEILKITFADAVLAAPELERRQISASLFVTFAIRNFVNRKNHIAVASAFAALYNSLICGRARHQVNASSRSQVIQLAARDGFFLAINDLAEELGDTLLELESNSPPDDKELDFNRVFLASGAVSDHFLWRARALATVAMLSLALIEAKRSNNGNFLSPKAQRAAEVLTRHGVTAYEIWGEGAIPQFLCLCWNWHNHDPSLRSNFAEYHLLKRLTHDLLSTDRGYLASPYHSDEESIRDRLPLPLGIERGSVKQEVLPHTSFFVEALFHCFIRSNLKSYAKGLWPSITKIGHHSFLPDNPWEYCLWRIGEGDNHTRQLAANQKWTELQIEASRIDTPHLPEGLRDDPLMLLAFTVFFPHRALPEVVRFLHFSICGTWFLPSTLPSQ